MSSYFLKFIFILIYIITGSYFINDDYSKILFSSSIILFSIIFLNVEFKKIIENKTISSISIIIYLILVIYASKENTFYLIIFGVNCFLVGFYEELLFRYSLFSKIVIKNKIIKSAIIVAVIFATAHFPNLRRYDLYSVIIQSYFAFLISIILTAIYIKFRSIFMISTIHGLVNFFGMIESKKIEYKGITTGNISIDINDLDRLLNSIISISIILSPFFLISIFYLHRYSKKTSSE